jgi:hypothetical protein
MWAHSIVVSPPLLDQDAGLLHRVEDLPVQEFVPQLPDDLIGTVTLLRHTILLLESV